MEKAQAELLKAAQLAWDSSAGWAKQAGASSENCPSPKGHLWALPCPQCDVEIHGEGRNQPLLSSQGHQDPPPPETEMRGQNNSDSK